MNPTIFHKSKFRTLPSDVAFSFPEERTLAAFEDHLSKVQNYFFEPWWKLKSPYLETSKLFFFSRNLFPTQSVIVLIEETLLTDWL